MADIEELQVSQQIYAGIGSRATPAPILQIMNMAAASLAQHGWILRSGGAVGADQAFEMGCSILNGMKEIFKSEDAEAWAYEEAAKHIPEGRPPFETWKPYTRGLVARNMMQILGKTGDQPVRFVLCWTQADVVDGGGTGYAMRCAAAQGIPVYNMNRDATTKALPIWDHPTPGMWEAWGN